MTGVPLSDAPQGIGTTIPRKRENIDVQDIDIALVIEVLRLGHPIGRVSFGDAMLWVVARAGNAQVWPLPRGF